MVAELAISTTVSRLREMLLESKFASLGVNDRVEHLLRDLVILRHFEVTDSIYMENNMVGQVNDWVNDIVDICYDVEALLTDCSLQLASSSSARKSEFKDALERYMCIFCEFVSSNKVELEILSFNKKIKNLTDRLQRYCRHIATDTDGEGSTRAPLRGRLLLERSKKPRYLSEEEDSILFQDKLEDLSEMCLEPRDLVISISGLPGSGKTVFTKSLFNHFNIAYRFDVRAWVVVGKINHPRPILLQLLGTMVAFSERSFLQMDDIELFELVYKKLKGRKFLIVLDDVQTNVWNTLRHAVPFDNVYSKVIIITTHVYEVPQTSKEQIVHFSLRFLTVPESWDLLRRRVFPNGAPDNEDHSNLDAVGQLMASMCNGLPLAVVALGNLLATKPISEWTKLLSYSDPYLAFAYDALTGYQGIIQIFSMSYNDLPHHVKPCFLFLGLFPEDSMIEAEKLYLLWMAEGIIPLEHGERITSMEMLVYSILEELAARRMVDVQLDEVSTLWRFKSCSFTKMARLFCLEKAKADNYFHVLDLRYLDFRIDNDGFFASTLKKHRLAIYIEYVEEYSIGLKQRVSNLLEKADHLRSLLFFSAYQDMPWPQELLPSLKALKFLRVLDFDGFSFLTSGLPEGLEKLVNLTYLSFKGCYLKELQSYIGNFWNLQILDLRVTASCKMIIPDILWKLERLRHLYLPDSFEPKGVDKLHFAGLSDLQTLHNFDTRVCNAKHLLQLTKLRILDATTSGNNEDLNTIIDFAEKTSECQIILNIRNFDCYSSKRREIVEKLFSCGGLQSLHVGGHIGKLPQINSSALTKLSFSGSELDIDSMATLANVTQLRALSLRDGAYIGEVMGFPDSGFPDLRLLEISGLDKLQTLTIEDRSMPNLITLVIERCKNLNVTLDAFSSLDKLQELNFVGMPTEFNNEIEIAKDEFCEAHPGLSIWTFSSSHWGQNAAWAQ